MRPDSSGYDAPGGATTATIVREQGLIVFDELFPILTTPDPARALSFYRDLLDGKVTYQFPAEGDPTFVAVRIGRSSVGISKQDQPGDLTNNRIILWVYTDDCDTAVERMRASGVTVIEEPADQPWGERTAIVADPDGNQVIIGARAASATGTGTS